MKTHHGEKGFTLIELLIVIAVLSALAAVVVPAVGTFLTSSKVAAANTEVANVRTAAMSYLADIGRFPENSDNLTGGISYISDPPAYGKYEFDSNSGQITKAIAQGEYGTIMHFAIDTQQWLKGKE